jgi:hypothetical protein
MPEGVLAAGYLVSTPQDMGRYLGMYLRGGLSEQGTRIVSPAGLRMLTAPGPQAHLGPWAGGASARYAMGWFAGGPWPGEEVRFHPGNSPDSSAMITLLPARGIAVATLMNLSHELPVPGNPAVTDRLSRNVVDAVIGASPTGRPSTTSFYALFDLAVLVMVGIAGWDCRSAIRAARRRAIPMRRTRGWVGAVVRILMIGGLVALPSSVGYGWPAAWLWAPDLTLTLGVLVALLAATAVLRGLALARGRPSSRGSVVESDGPSVLVAGPTSRTE